MKVKKIELLPAFNSRGEKTVKVVLEVEGGARFISIAPSGASKSSYEKREAGFEEIKSAFKEVRERIEGKDIDNIDELIEDLPGNLSIAISQAFYKAVWSNVEIAHFPKPLSNIIGGGAHGGYTSIQEFLVYNEERDIERAVEVNIEARKLAEKLLNSRVRNDEGAIVAKVDDFKALEVLARIGEELSCKIGIDAAATQFFKEGYYIFSGKRYSPGEFIDVMKETIEIYGLSYVEDPFHENHVEAFKELTRKVKGRCIVCGDDVVATRIDRLEMCIENECISGVIVKPNQVGVVSKAVEVVERARKNGIVPVASHRSGETEDYFIALFACVTKCEMLKCSVFGSERFSKWNYLIERKYLSKTL